MNRLRSVLKSILGQVPVFVELWQRIRPASGEIPGGYRLDRLQSELPAWVRSVSQAREKEDNGATLLIEIQIFQVDQEAFPRVGVNERRGRRRKERGFHSLPPGCLP